MTDVLKHDFELSSKDLTANGQTFAVRCDGFSTISVIMATSALSGHSVVFEASNDAGQDPYTGEWDGSTGDWFSVIGQRSNASSVESSISSLSAKLSYSLIFSNTPSFRFFRIRVTAHTSGIAAWKIGRSTATTSIIPSTVMQINTSSGSGGITSSQRLLSAANSINATTVKASAGRLFGIKLYNASAGVRWLKIYNKASSPVPASDTPIFSFYLEPNSMFEVDNFGGSIGYYFSSGIAYVLTTGSGDTDTGALTAGDVQGLNIWYA